MENNTDQPHLSCLAKQDKIKKTFRAYATADEKYHKIIELGQSNPPLAPEFKTSNNLVSGCLTRIHETPKYERS